MYVLLFFFDLATITSLILRMGILGYYPISCVSKLINDGTFTVKVSEVLFKQEPVVVKCNL